MDKDFDPSQKPDDLERERRLFEKAIGDALTGYAKDGGTWELAKGHFMKALEEGDRVDAALYEALDVAREGAETSPGDATRRFWSDFPVDEAIGKALTGYAKDGGTWELGKWTFEHEMNETTPFVDVALHTALETVSDGAESTMEAATDNFWRVIHPSHAASIEKAALGDIGDGIQLGDLLHRPVRKDSRSGTYEGEMAGKQVIVKQGDATELAREHKILSVVDYRGIPKVLSFSENEAGIGGLSRLAMEKMPGESMKSLLKVDKEWKSNKLSEKEAVAIADGLASCFSALNDSGYIYRDLNLDHILLDKQDDAYAVSLIDVEGSGKKDEAGNAIVGNPMVDRGTWETMAPEEFHEGARLNESGSVFSVATVLYQMLIGESPYRVPDELSNDLKTLQRFSAFVHERPVVVPYEGKLGEVMRVALNPDPAKRYQTLSDFRQALANAL